MRTCSAVDHLRWRRPWLSRQSFALPHLASKLGVQPLQLAPGAARLSGVRVAAIHHQRPLAEPLKALLEYDPAGPCHAHQRRTGFEVQPRIRRVRFGFVLHGGVDVDDAERCGGHCLRGKARFDGQREHELTARLANTGSKARHLRGINRRRVFEVLLAAEILPRRQGRKYAAGFSTQRSTTSSSERLKACFK